MATTPDYSDWKLRARHLLELLPTAAHRQDKNIKFVAWSIRYMARMGALLFANGTAHSGGHTKHELLSAYDKDNPDNPRVANSVLNNRRVPPLGVLWQIATELVTNTELVKNGLTVSQSRNGCMPLHGNGIRIIRSTAPPTVLFASSSILLCIATRRRGGHLQILSLEAKSDLDLPLL